MTKINNKGELSLSINDPKSVLRTCPVCYGRKNVLEFNKRICRECRIAQEAAMPAGVWKQITSVRDRFVIDVWLNYGVWHKVKTPGEAKCPRCSKRILTREHVACVTAKPSRQFLVCYPCGMELLEKLVRKDI